MRFLCNSSVFVDGIHWFSFSTHPNYYRPVVKYVNHSIPVRPFDVHLGETVYIRDDDGRILTDSS